MNHPDDAGFEYTSDSEWDRAAACDLGADRPHLAWICTDRDVWHQNPYYTGPAVPHPEDDRDSDEPTEPYVPADNSDPW